MTAPVQQVLDAFDALADADKHEAAVEILRRIGGKHADLPENALSEIADALFFSLDDEESSHAAG